MQEKRPWRTGGDRPDLGGLQRGDLVFWKGHVGIMLDATRLLHATGHTMTVTVEPLAIAEERIRTRTTARSLDQTALTSPRRGLDHFR